MFQYFSIINILTFLAMGFDKNQAIHKKRRISEITLISLSFLGGGFGSLLGMNIFHHKTKKVKFILLIPLSILLTIIFITMFD